MHHLKTIRLTCILIALLPTLLVRAAATPPAIATPIFPFHCHGAWSLVPSPNPSNFDSSLNAVAAVSPNDVWAVGATGSQPLIEHWNGAYWQIVPNPGYGFLSAVTALSATNVWAVGFSYYGELIEHWDGAHWSIVPSPNILDHFLVSITAVSPNDIWAAGFQVYRNNDRHTLIEHWNGTKWRVVSSPNPRPAFNYLLGISAVSSTDVWAVGDYFKGKNGPLPLLEHYDGKHWRLAHTPGGYNYLAAVTAVDASHIWVVGQYSNNYGGYTLIERWDGSRWHIVPNPGLFDGELMAVAASTNENIWTVGGNYAQTITEHWDGTGMNWQLIPSPFEPGFDNYLTGVAITSAHTAWAVGYFQPINKPPDTPLIEYYC